MIPELSVSTKTEILILTFSVFYYSALSIYRYYYIVLIKIMKYVENETLTA